MLTKKQLDKLKAKLPRGYFAKTVAKSTYGERTVAKFFSGEVYRQEIHEAALEVLEEEKNSNKAVITQHNSLI